jgi:hypothetical protein
MLAEPSCLCVLLTHRALTSFFCRSMNDGEQLGLYKQSQQQHAPGRGQL